MSDKSPLFVSALELLAHATELYAQGHPRKYKFVILHLANAVELILKDCLIDQGVSIYKHPKETHTIWGAYAELQKLNITVSGWPVIELLIDDRNTIQHRFGFPDAEAVYYYLDQVVAFFQKFLGEHYKLLLVEVLEPHLSKEHLQMLGLVRNEYGYLSDLMKLSHEAAIVQAYKVVEAKVKKYLSPFLSELRGTLDPLYWRKPLFSEFLHDLEQKGFLSEGIYERFLELRNARNAAAHVAVVEDTSINWQKVFNTAQELIAGLQKAETSDYKFLRRSHSNMTEETASED